MKLNRKYLLALAGGLVVLPLLLLLEIKLNQDTRQQTDESFNETQNIVLSKEYGFKRLARTFLQDSLQLTRSQQSMVDLGTEENVTINVFRSDSLIFWNRNDLSGQRYLNVLKEGMAYLTTSNGAYLSFFKQSGRFKVAMFYNIKTNYPYQNQYIQNHFNDELNFLGSALLSPSPIKDFKDLHDVKGNYLFSIQIFGKDRPTPDGLKLLILAAILWILYFFCQLMEVFINKHFYYGSLLFLTLMLSARTVFVMFKIPIFIYGLELFSPDIYASSKVNPSLGDFMILIGILLLYFWLIRKIHFRAPKRKSSLMLYFMLACWTTITLADGAFDSIKSLVFDSQISFDINNLYALNVFTFLGLILAVMLLLVAYQMSIRLYHLFDKSELNAYEKVFLTGIVFYFLHPFLVRYLYERNIYFPIGSSTLIISFLLFEHLLRRRINRLQQYLIMVLILSIFTSFFLYYWSYREEQESRLLFGGKLISQNDINTEYFLKSTEKQLLADKRLKNFFLDKRILKSGLVKEIRPLYFTGYLSKYDVSLYDFDSLGDHRLSRNPYSFKQLNYAFKKLATQTINSNFRFLGSSTFIKGYLGRFIVYKGGRITGFLFIHLEPKLIQDENRFEELLIEGFRTPLNRHSNYSYAIYRDRQLLSQSGPFAYRTAFTFLMPQKHYHFVEEDDYDHLVIKESDQFTVVVSKPAAPWYEPFGLFSLSFTFFTLVLILSILVYVIFNNGWINAQNVLGTKHWFMLVKAKVNAMLFFGDADLSLIRTRIQLGIILIVFVTLSVTAFFTIGLLNQQNNEKQSEKLLKKIRSVATAIESETQYGNLNLKGPAASSFINQIADFYETEITLFDPQGMEMTSTIRKLYDDALIAPIMDQDAFYHLSFLRESQYIQSEKVATFTFTACYVPIWSKNKQLLGYVQLPYFNRYADLYAEISSIIVGFINLYALLFIVIGILAWVVSRNISFPLLLIQKQMAETIIGRKNEPIQWARRDEIGALVAQYNQMIDKLEESANKLAQSEREGAWRDIARQIAHEIKNPLTPMKLSIQHLERAWNDQSPKLPETMKRVTKTLITQIDSLSELATEFSSFAKMPAPTYESIPVKELCEQVALLQQQGFNGLIEVNCDENIVLHYDRGYLNRTLTNLVKNAVQAIPETKEGSIILQVKEEAEHLLITVTDNGSGIPESQVDSIFTPYFSTKVIGMGLGLPIVKSMVESGGGRIWFTTVPNEGTTFYIELPLMHHA